MLFLNPSDHLTSLVYYGEPLLDLGAACRYRSTRSLTVCEAHLLTNVEFGGVPQYLTKRIEELALVG